MKEFNLKIKNMVKRSHTMYSIASFFLRTKTFLLGGISVENHGNGSFKKDVIGNDNYLYIGKGTMIHKSIIRIRGNNNKIIVGDNCKIRKNCSFWIQGNNCSIVLGNHVTMQHSNHFNCSEDNNKIIVGNDCMFSNNIIIRTGDGHGIFDIRTRRRLNYGMDVKIGNHVWIAPNSRIMKGAIVEDGSIIGSNTMVTKHISANCLAVGMPAKVVKENVFWDNATILKVEQ